MTVRGGVACTIAMALIALTLIASPVGALTIVGEAPSVLDATIQIVWPHSRDGSAQPVSTATLVNASVFLFLQGTLHPFCPIDPGGVAVGLTTAVNNGIPVLSGSAGVPRRIARGGLIFFAWDFNDIDVDAATDARNRVYLEPQDFLSVPPPSQLVGGKVSVSVNVQRNIWAHGANALTAFPVQDTPSGTSTAPPPGTLPQLDPKIEIVWPHDRLGQRASVLGADLANLSVTVFLYGTLTSVTPYYDEPVQLYAALNQAPLRPIAFGQKRLVIAPQGFTYPVWDFNNIDVSAARDSANKYFFQVKTRDNWSNVWAHGADGRTLFPMPDIPDQSCPPT